MYMDSVPRRRVGVRAPTGQKIDIYNAIIGVSGVAIFYLLGIAVYYLSIGALYQAVYLVPLALLALALSSPSGVTTALRTPTMGMLAIFTLYTIIMKAGQSSSFPDFLLGVRIYLPILCFALVMGASQKPGNLIDMLEKAIVVYPLIQLPFVLQQLLIVAARRRGTGWDAVVGTMGGNSNAGGDSAGLALCSLLSLLVTLYMMKHKKMPRMQCWAALAAGAACLLLTEVKLIIVLMPILLIVQQPRSLFLKPGRALMVAAAAISFSLITVTVYQTLFWSKDITSREQKTFEQSIAYIFDERNVNVLTREVGRGASFMLWLNDSTLNAGERVLGFGAASTRVSALAVGPVGERFYPLDVGSVGIVQLLWDSGVAGTFMFMSVLFIAYSRARKLARMSSDSLDQARLRTLSALACGLLVFMFYNRTVVDLPVEQFLLGALVGLLALFELKARRRVTR